MIVSLQIAIQNGRRYIQELAGKLFLSQHVVDSAHRLYILAVQRNFVQVCREGNPQLYCRRGFC